MTKVTMTKVKDCKHSVPFKTENPDAPIATVYIKRPMATNWSAVEQIVEGETITLKGVTL
jgi:hypothetical protein